MVLLLVEHLPSVCEALGLVPSTAETGWTGQACNPSSQEVELGAFGGCPSRERAGFLGREKAWLLCRRQPASSSLRASGIRDVDQCFCLSGKGLPRASWKVI